MVSNQLLRSYDLLSVFCDKCECLHALLDCQDAAGSWSESFATQEVICVGWPVCGTAHGLNQECTCRSSWKRRSEWAQYIAEAAPVPHLAML